MLSAPFQASVDLDVPWIIEFKKNTQRKLSFSFGIPVATPISSAALAAFAWDINITVVITVTKHGRNSKCFCRRVRAEEDLGLGDLEVSKESLADEPKHVVCVLVILLKKSCPCHMCGVNLQL